MSPAPLHVGHLCQSTMLFRIVWVLLSQAFAGVAWVRCWFCCDIAGGMLLRLRWQWNILSRLGVALLSFVLVFWCVFGLPSLRPSRLLTHAIRRHFVWQELGNRSGPFGGWWPDLGGHLLGTPARVEIWCPILDLSKDMWLEQTGQLGPKWACRPWRSAQLYRQDFFMQNGIVISGIRLVLAPKAVERHLDEQCRWCHAGRHHWCGNAFEMQLVWNHEGKFYFKPEQQCATESEFLEKHFGFGRVFVRWWKHGNMRMFPWQLAFGNTHWKKTFCFDKKLEKAFCFTNESMWLYNMLELERNLVFTSISKQFARELMWDVSQHRRMLTTERQSFW